VSLKPDLHEHTILIIDDNPANLGVLSSCLEEAGFETMVAIDGKSGLNIARDGQPDLILLDVLMPGMDGFEACRFMKEDERTREIPVIFMTALTETENEVAGFEAGGVDYITKPFQVEEVLARVKTHLALLLIQKRLKARNVQLLREIGKRQKVEKELRKARAELEERVEACTAELREANTRLTTEIDERKRAEKALFHEKEQFSVTLRSIEDGVVTTDKEGRVLFVNKAAESLTHSRGKPCRNDPRLNDRIHIFFVDLEDFIHRVRENHNPVLLGDGSSAEICTGPPGGERQSVLVTEPKDIA